MGPAEYVQGGPGNDSDVYVDLDVRAHSCDCCRQLQHRLDKMERQLAELLRRTPDRTPARVDLTAT